MMMIIIINATKLTHTGMVAVPSRESWDVKRCCRGIKLNYTKRTQAGVSAKQGDMERGYDGGEFRLLWHFR